MEFIKSYCLLKKTLQLLLVVLQNLLVAIQCLNVIEIWKMVQLGVAILTITTCSITI